MNIRLFRPFLMCLLFAAYGLPVSRAADSSKPLKVFILAGQSNMEGQAVADLDGKDYNDGKGTLNALLKDPAKAPLVKHLKTEKGEWTVRDDVWVRYQREKAAAPRGAADAGLYALRRQAPLRPRIAIRPRYRRPLRQSGAAHQDRVGRQEPVQGLPSAEFRRRGRALLHEDDRGHSQGSREPQDRLSRVTHGQGYELAGFVWYQGWNDGVDPKKAVPEYEQNLVNLIKDVRKDFKAPKLPFVIGELTGPWVQGAGGMGHAPESAGRRGRTAGVQGQRALRRDARLRPHRPKESPNPRPRPPRVRQRGDLFPRRRCSGQGDDRTARSPAETTRRSRPSQPRTPSANSKAGPSAWMTDC